MIPLINHDFQWGRSEVVIIYPDFIILNHPFYEATTILGTMAMGRGSGSHFPGTLVNIQMPRGWRGIDDVAMVSSTPKSTRWNQKKSFRFPIGSMVLVYMLTLGVYWYILMVNVTIYSIHGSYGKSTAGKFFFPRRSSPGNPQFRHREMFHRTLSSNARSWLWSPPKRCA